MKAAVLLLAMVIIFALAVAPAAATTEIAAQFDFFALGGIATLLPFSANCVYAQTFVPTLSGPLSSIDALVHIAYGGDPGGIPISFEIRSVWASDLNGWQPDFSVPALSTGSLDASTPGLGGLFYDWMNVSMTPFELEAGTMYAIVASAVGTDMDYRWYSKGDGTAYPAGTGMQGYSGQSDPLGPQNWDLPFRVWVTIPPANQAPVLDVSAAPTAGAVGQAVTFTATATDPDADDTLAFGLSGEPAGATIDPATGHFSWTPASAGTVSFSVIVTDAGGLLDSETVTVDISALCISEATVVSKGKTYSVTVQISNPGSAAAYDVTITAAGLDGSETNSPLPLSFGVIKPGTTKQCKLQFKAVDSGLQDLSIQGTSSLGNFFGTQTVAVP